ncbi:MAG: hypothetical protein WCO60_07250 [Verrucomicrobiota bacterium]
MTSSRNSFLAIGGSALLGGFAALLALPPRTNPVAGAASTSVPLGRDSKQPAPGTKQEATDTTVQVQNTSEDEGFETWPTEKQKETLLRLRTKYGAFSLYPTNVQLWLARQAKGLSGDQISNLLEALPSGKDADANTRRLLIERLAAEDPQRAIELARKLKDETLIGTAVASVAQKSGPEALRLLAGVKESELGRILNQMTSPVWPSRFNGSVSDVADFLRKNTKLAEGSKANQFGSLCGKLVAQSAGDSTAELEEVRVLARELAGNGKADQTEDAKKNSADAFLKYVTDHAYRGFVGNSPEKGSAFLDGVPESQKSSWLLQVDAVSKYRNEGLESAIQLAEKQGGDEFVKMAASGTWVALAQENRKDALAWVETLPEGPFRQGAYMGVLMDAFRYVGNEMGLQHAIEAAQELSPQSKVGYYDELIQLSRQWGTMWGSPTPGQIIERTPLTPEQKDELYRRVAPIRAK